MDTLKDLINEHGPLLIDKLECIGFSVNQANNFLPEVAKAIDSALATGRIDFQALFSDEDVEPLLSRFNPNEIAKKTEIDTNQVVNGIMGIWPFIVQKLAAKIDRLANPQTYFIRGVESINQSSFENLRKTFLS